MATTKTLGGDRLGSGKKQKIQLHGFERSTHDLGHIFRTTMSSGTLVPFLKLLALPGDTFDINLDCDVKTHPTVGPLFASYKVQLDIFQAPLRLYQGLLHNNKLGIGLNMQTVKIPQMELISSTLDTTEGIDWDNQQINPSCILSYLGIRGVATKLDPAGTGIRNFNAIPLLAYWDIYKNYYANKQEEIGAVIHRPLAALNETITSITVNGSVLSQAPTQDSEPWNTGSGMVITYVGAAPNPYALIVNTNQGLKNITDIAEIVGATATTFTLLSRNLGNIILINWDYAPAVTTAPPVVTTFDLEKLDDMREYLLANLGTSPIIINDAALEPYSLLLDWVSGQAPYRQNQEGLAVKTYQSDLFNNWLSTEWIDGTGGINEITAIDTTSGSFTLDTLNLSKKVYEMLNRIAVSGGSYDDWLDAQYQHDRITRAETPIYHGGLSKELIFQEITSNSASDVQATQPLGTLAGKGVMAQKHKGGSVIVKVDEPGYIIGIISLTPRIDYSQGNEWDTHLETIDDIHKPMLDEIGFQELITEQMAWWTTTDNLGTFETKSAGKQPAWINYMTAINKSLGNFAIENNEMFMTLNRRYEHATNDDNITDLTTYIDPEKFNFVFAQTSIDAQNFWTQIAIDITARRKMSAKVMPNL